jgi:hypothetical protein
MIYKDVSISALLLLPRYLGVEGVQVFLGLLDSEAE